VLLPSGLLRLLGDFRAIPGNSSALIDHLPDHVQAAYLQNILVDKYVDVRYFYCFYCWLLFQFS
jgi:hypothetical protein